MQKETSTYGPTIREGMRWFREKQQVVESLFPPPCHTGDIGRLLKVACGDKGGRICVYDLEEMELAHMQVRQ